jgi:hypothetical protein
MSKRALIAGAIAAVIGAAYLLYPREAQKVEPPAVLDAGIAVAKGPHLREDGRSLIPPTLPQQPVKKEAAAETKPKVEEEKPLPDLDEKNDPLTGLELEEPTTAELTELKVPEGMTGIVVKKVDPASPAAEAKLEKGDVIVRAQRDKITNERSLRAAVGDRDQTVLTVYRHGYPFQVVLHKPFHGTP